MEKKPKFTRFDVLDHLTDENIVKRYLEAMREDGTENEIRLAENDAERACALYGINPAVVGLTPENNLLNQNTVTTRQIRKTVTA
jgi:DNA-binding phage protein